LGLTDLFQEDFGNFSIVLSKEVVGFGSYRVHIVRTADSLPDLVSLDSTVGLQLGEVEAHCRGGHTQVSRDVFDGGSAA
jgi:hypothetical protein